MRETIAPPVFDGLPADAQHILNRVYARSDQHISKSEALRLIRSLWKNTFNVNAPQPLKVGIHDDMVADGRLPEPIIQKALGFFTSLESYLNSIKSGVSRIDLNGQECGKVRLHEAVDAEVRLFISSSDFKPNRKTVVVKKLRVVAINESFLL